MLSLQGGKVPNSKKVLIRLEHGKRRSFLLFVGVAFLSFLAGGVSAGNSVQPIGPMSLVDRWVRPDGGYILELREFGTDGSLVAAYYNPKPIHVGRAGWRPAQQGLDLFVELRDVDYPGSIYTLHYDPVTDRMHGVYFQAMYQQQYQVLFIRSR
jgi:hypothetical protein